MLIRYQYLGILIREGLGWVEGSCSAGVLPFLGPSCLCCTHELPAPDEKRLTGCIRTHHLPMGEEVCCTHSPRAVENNNLLNMHDLLALPFPSFPYSQIGVFWDHFLNKILAQIFVSGFAFCKRNLKHHSLKEYSY